MKSMAILSIYYCERSELSGLFNGTDFLYNYCERSELSGLFDGTDFIYIILFQAVRRAVNVLNVSMCI